MLLFVIFSYSMDWHTNAEITIHYEMKSLILALQKREKKLRFLMFNFEL